jgi:hypothetical protein
MKISRAPEEMFGDQPRLKESETGMYDNEEE